MDYRELTKEDIEQYETEIKNFMNYRNILFWCAIGSLVARYRSLSLRYSFVISNINSMNGQCGYLDSLLSLV